MKTLSVNNVFFDSFVIPLLVIFEAALVGWFKRQPIHSNVYTKTLANRAPLGTLSMQLITFTYFSGSAIATLTSSPNTYSQSSANQSKVGRAYLLKLHLSTVAKCVV